MNQLELLIDISNLRFASIRDMIAKDRCLSTCVGMTNEEYTKECRESLAKYDYLLAELGKDKLYKEDIDRISEILKGMNL